MTERDVVKVFDGPAADCRFACEVLAHRHSNRFWTRSAPGWSHPAVTSIDLDRPALSFERVVGRSMTWDDLDLLTTALVGVAAVVGELADPWIHGDLHPGNVIIAADGLALVDWELSRSGTFEEDLGSLLAHAILRDQRNCSSTALAHRVVESVSPVISRPDLLARARVDLEAQRRREAGVGDALRAAHRLDALTALEDLA